MAAPARSSGVRKMGIDILSYALGKAAGGGGGGGGSSGLGVWKVGGFADPAGKTGTSFSFTINGYNGKWALISVMHRDTLTAPTGCVLLDKSEFCDGSTTQYVSNFKMQLTSDSVTLVFSQASSQRYNVLVWAFDGDYTLEKKDTQTIKAYNEVSHEFTTQELSFVTYSAYSGNTTSSSYSLPMSNGAWICWEGQIISVANPAIRHMTGIVPASSSPKSWWINQYNSYNATWSINAQVVVYTISKV